MSKEVTIYLVDLAKNSEFQTTEYTRKVMEAIRDRLDTYFERICKENKAFSSARVTWEKSTPKETDIVVYVIVLSREQHHL